MRKLRQGRHAGPPGLQTRVVGGVGQAQVLEHYRHGGRVGGDRGGLRELSGPNQ
jgi:hypothetical protein